VLGPACTRPPARAREAHNWATVRAACMMHSPGSPLPLMQAASNRLLALSACSSCQGLPWPPPVLLVWLKITAWVHGRQRHWHGGSSYGLFVCRAHAATPATPAPSTHESIAYHRSLADMLQRGQTTQRAGAAARHPCRPASHPSRRPVVLARAEASPVATVDAAALYTELDSACDTLRRAPYSQVGSRTSSRM
jgi:hypothetical protein